MWSALLACLAIMADGIPPELDAYIKRPDSSFSWSLKPQGLGALHIRMTSQTWRIVRWTHDIVLVRPAGGTEGQRVRGTEDQRVEGSKGRRATRDEEAAPSRIAHRASHSAQSAIRNPKSAILYITGGEPNPADIRDAQKLADLAKMPVAVLFQIPNQPLFGLKEDALIAYTFEQFLLEESNPKSEIQNPKSPDWPLLFPMAKAAVRAMDALAQATKGELAKFVVTGVSKRGWTSWMAAATGDERIIGIAPMSFNNLNFKKQLAYQLETWGKYSEMIADYTDKGLDQVLESPPGARLLAMVDPWFYRERITVPKLILNGSNDRYWVPNASNWYFNDLQGPKWEAMAPNQGHNLGDMDFALRTLAGFARSCAGEFKIPEVNYGGMEKGGETGVSAFTDTKVPELKEVVFWMAKSATKDFRDSVWSVVPSTTRIDPDGTLHARFMISGKFEGHAIAFAESRFQINGLKFSLTSSVFYLK